MWLICWRLTLETNSVMSDKGTLFICLCVSSSPAVQRLCEDGRVEAKAATGRDCSDEAPPEGNGNTQQYVYT